MPLFELNNASARYNGVAVLHDISLCIEQGERVAFVGPSGAGKSTLLNLLYEQDKSDSALVPQDLGLVQALSVFHNIFMGRLHKNRTLYNLANLIKPLKGELEAIVPIVRRLGLEDKLFAPIGELSGGQQQRTAVGRALYKGSPVFFGDEPVSSVDEHQSRVVLGEITETHETVLLSMHDVGLAIAYSDRIIGLRHGKIVLDQSTDGLNAQDLDGLYKP